MTLTVVTEATARERVERVLVVDDDADVKRLLQMRLSARGYNVATAANGNEALELIGQDPPDVVFLDVSMPGISGLDVLDRLRAERHDVAIVMTTAYGSEQVAIEALRRGADDYLRKPFERQEFTAVLERTVSRLELARQNAMLRRQLDEKRRQLETELARAAEVQADLLPASVPPLIGFDLAARCIPAREVGGDFYDWQGTPTETRLTLGDVMGKGMPAALLMATVRGTLRALAGHSAPARTVEITGRALATDLERSGSFLTLFHAALNTTTRRLTFVDAGHGLAFVRRADGRVEDLAPRGLPLGVFPNATYEQGTLLFRPGDVLVVHSDGLVEALSNRLSDPRQLARLLPRGASAEELVERLVGVADLSDLVDDLTVVVLRCAE